MTTRYKFLHLRNNQITSHSDNNCTWKIGQWQELSGEPDLCAYGFHCSQKPLDALSYVQGEIVAQVEVGGKCAEGDDKEAWQRMRIVQAWHWEKEDSVKLAIFAAEKVLSIYEDYKPGDLRPRRAIEAAKKWLEDPSAARAADAAATRAADAAYAADAAARAAARAARAAADAAAYAAAAADAATGAADAAYAAYAAARAAADAAARAAAYAAARAARAAIINDINAWMEAHLAELELVGQEVAQ